MSYRQTIDHECGHVAEIKKQMKYAGGEKTVFIADSQKEGNGQKAPSAARRRSASLAGLFWYPWHGACLCADLRVSPGGKRGEALGKVANDPPGAVSICRGKRNSAPRGCCVQAFDQRLVIELVGTAYDQLGQGGQAGLQGRGVLHQCIVVGVVRGLQQRAARC